MAQQAWRGCLRFSLQPLGMFGLAICSSFFAALAAPWLTSYDPVTQNLLSVFSRHSPSTGLEPMSSAGYLRPDVYGARTTLYIIMLVTIIVAPIGLL